ncbi:MAG: AAA family ATPase [Pseudomonadota bacterium]|nr:AAA family ATPase [Pseudomonadota bacterium]
MRRFIEEDLKQWKDSGRRKPLILHGARQVGKTYSLKEFGGKHFDSVAVVDSEKHQTAKEGLSPYPNPPRGRSPGGLGIRRQNRR